MIAALQQAARLWREWRTRRQWDAAHPSVWEWKQ